jgi:hypothetical protein
MIPALVLTLALSAAAAAGDPPRKVAEKRLAFDPEGRRTLKGQLFTGTSFVEEEWGRAELSYEAGVLHGPVVVIVRNKLFSQFRYDRGVRVLDPSAE